jgi:hypothetical protein
VTKLEVLFYIGPAGYSNAVCYIIELARTSSSLLELNCNVTEVAKSSRAVLKLVRYVIKLTRATTSVLLSSSALLYFRPTCHVIELVYYVVLKLPLAV